MKILQEVELKSKNVFKMINIRKLALFIAFIILFRISITAITFYIKALENCFNKDYYIQIPKNIIECLVIVCTNKTVALICLIIALIYIFLIFNIYFSKKQLKNEIEGISFKEKDGTHGTANFIKPQDIKELSIGNEEQVNGIVLGKTLDTDELIVLPDKCKTINRNIMVWGASGSRKIHKLYNT